MKLAKYLKKSCALSLAILTLLTSSNLVTPEVLAADNYFIKVQDKNTGELGSNIDVIATEQLIVKTQIPSNYSIVSDDPFLITCGNSSVGQQADDAFFYSSPAGKNTYTTLVYKKALLGTSTTGDPEALNHQDHVEIYTIQGNYTATDQFTGTGGAEGPGGPANSGTEPARVSYSLTGTARKGLPLTTSSTLVMEARTSQNAENGGFDLVLNDNLSSGYLAALYRGGKVYLEEFNTAAQTFTVRIEAAVLDSGASGGNQANPIWIDFKYQAPPIKVPDPNDPNAPKIDATYLVQEGTKFTVTFYRPDDVSPLVINVHSSYNAVKTEVNSILSNGENSVGEDDKKYIMLANGDTFKGITSNFNVRTSVPRFNSKLDIEWKWVPDETYIGDDGKPVRFDDATLESYRKNLVFDDDTAKLVNLPAENVKGKLVATVSHLPKVYSPTDDGSSVSEIAEIPVTILGTGTIPYIQNNVWMQGYYDTATGTQKDILTLNEKLPPTVMDAYDGHVNKDVYDVDPDAPYQFRATAYFGKGQGKAEKLVVEKKTTGGADVQLFFGQGDAQSPYEWGSDLPNTATGTAEYAQSFRVRATNGDGSVVLAFKYYNAKGYNTQTYTYTINVHDNSPSNDATLKTLDMRAILDPNPAEGAVETFEKVYPDHMIDFGFESGISDYQAIYLPNVVEKITLKPTYNLDPPSKKKIKISWGNGPDQFYEVSNREESSEIQLVEDREYTIRISCRAQDDSPLDYILKVTRMPKSSVNTLDKIAVKPQKGAPEEEDYTMAPEFQPDVTGVYQVEVPYNQDSVYIEATATNAWAAGVDIEKIGTQRAKANFRSVADRFTKTKGALIEDLICDYDLDTGEIINNVTHVQVTVTPETGGRTLTYLVDIYRLPPSTNNDLSNLQVYLGKNQESPISFADGQVFVKSDREYLVNIPYSTEYINFEMTPDDIEHALSTTIIPPEILLQDGDEKQKTLQNKGEPVTYTSPKMSQGENPDPDLNDMTFQIYVSAESDGKSTPPYREPPYTLRVIRNEPNRESSLSSMTVVDIDTNTPVKEFSFNPQKTEYTFNVPFTTEQVLISPVAKDPTCIVYVKIGEDEEKKITQSSPGKTAKLESGVVTKVLVRVLPESGTPDQTIYTLNITRLAPGKEARLSALVVNGGTDQKPTPFVPNTTTYSWTIPEGTKTYTVTATAVDPAATITINDVAAPNGAPSEAFSSTEPNSKIIVKVTAQDGKTTKTYTLNIKDYNLIKKSDNADLSNLTVMTGDLSPKFSRSTLDYEVYVKPNAMDLTLKPRKANANATMTVFAESRKLTEYDGGYTSSLLEDETEFRVTVVSEDGTNTKEYVLTVYKNDEEKQGNYKPIESDMVNFEASDPIQIDVSKYPLVSAEIFNTLKTDYPDKTVVFKGNDYTLEMKGSDMNQLVPNTDYFDLSFSFASPEETEIYDLIDERSSNNIDPVFLYFDHHGALPCEMLLTVSLGREYRNEQLYWNYYNSDRDRIDYYGYVRTNAKGTFSVPIDHFSTYLITERKIRGAENKSGLDYSGNPVEGAADDGRNMNSGTTGGKVNPNTGVNAGGTQ